MARLKTVIHIHTNYSHDSNTTVEELLETARRQGVECLAITDHDEIGGALEAQHRAADDGVRVIVGEEISSVAGHIIGLFLTQLIPPGLPAEETIARIREQGGLVLAPHPGARLCAESMSLKTLTTLIGQFDAIEVANAQNLFWWEHRHGRRIARQYRRAAYVGADTHLRGYLDGCYQLLEPFEGPTEFLASLRGAQLSAGLFPPSYFLRIGVEHFRGRLGEGRAGEFGLNVVENRLGR